MILSGKNRWMYGWVPLALAMSSALAAELPAASRMEIDAVLNKLGSSGCQFSRNGSWYTAVEAKAHLSKKLDYLVDKKKVDGTEQFIALAGTSSSMSGKEYQVKCGAAQPVASATWLKTELHAIRARQAPAK